jgi:hypothetical protein
MYSQEVSTTFTVKTAMYSQEVSTTFTVVLTVKGVLTY